MDQDRQGRDREQDEVRDRARVAEGAVWAARPPARVETVSAPLAGTQFLTRRDSHAISLNAPSVALS